LYKLEQFWGLAGKLQKQFKNKNLKMQGISGFGRFFIA